MNPYTGEIAQLKKAIPDVPTKSLEGAIDEMIGARALTPEQAKEEGFQELPQALNRAARRALAQGRNPISLNSSGKLSRWARQQRRQKGER